MIEDETLEKITQEDVQKIRTAAAELIYMSGKVYGFRHSRTKGIERHRIMSNELHNLANRLEEELYANQN